MDKKNNLQRNTRKSLIGVVVSTKNNKTVTVKVERKYKHKIYKKLVITHKKYAVHDENNQAKLNDTVLITETRPLSKTKHFYVAKIIKKAA